MNLGWDILADCFEPMETGIHSELIDQFWPKSDDNSQEPGITPEPNTDN